MEKEREKLKKKADSEGEKAIKRPVSRRGRMAIDVDAQCLQEAWSGFKIKADYFVFWQGRSDGERRRFCSLRPTVAN